MGPINIRIDNDLKTPDDLQGYSGLNSQNFPSRNLMKTHATNFYKPNYEKNDSLGVARD